MRLATWVVWTALWLTTTLPAHAPDKTPESCEPATAWAAFERSLQQYYANLDRADFDVKAQLGHARRRVGAARTPAEMRTRLLRTTCAFTDPHLPITPLTGEDANVIPTSGDLRVVMSKGRAVVSQVRLDSAAASAGLRPGWVLTRVGEVPTAAAIKALLGGVVLAKTGKQRSDAATLVANAGHGHPRTLSFDPGAGVSRLMIPNPRQFASEVKRRPAVTLRRTGTLTILRLKSSLARPETVAAFGKAIAGVLDACCSGH